MVGQVIDGLWFIAYYLFIYYSLFIYDKSMSKSKCYPSFRLDGVNGYTASGPHVAPHQPVNHHTTVTLLIYGRGQHFLHLPLSLS